MKITFELLPWWPRPLRSRHGIIPLASSEQEQELLFDAMPARCHEFHSRRHRDVASSVEPIEKLMFPLPEIIRRSLASSYSQPSRLPARQHVESVQTELFVEGRVRHSRSKKVNSSIRLRFGSVSSDGQRAVSKRRRVVPQGTERNRERERKKEKTKVQPSEHPRPPEQEDSPGEGQKTTKGSKGKLTTTNESEGKRNEEESGTEEGREGTVTAHKDKKL